MWGPRIFITVMFLIVAFELYGVYKLAGYFFK